jgi:hypothetical protein
MLLPLPQKEIEKVSLSNHLALAVCRKDPGDRRQLSELARAVYLTYYLQGYGYGDAPIELYQRARSAVDAAYARGQISGVWAIQESEAADIEEILCIQDLQLAVVPVRVVLEAHARLDRYSRNDMPSPIPDLAKPH